MSTDVTCDSMGVERERGGKGERRNGAKEEGRRERERGKEDREREIKKPMKKSDVQAYSWTVCDAESLGLRLAQVTPSTETRELQTAFVPKTHADDGLFLLLKAAELSREWQRELWWYSWT